MNPSYGEQYDINATASLALATTSLPLPHPTRTSGSRSFPGKVGPCGLCKQDHSICECPELMRRTPDKRKEFVLKEGLCFGCLCPGRMFPFCYRLMVQAAGRPIGGERRAGAAQWNTGEAAEWASRGNISATTVTRDNLGR